MMEIENIETVIPGVVEAVNSDGTLNCRPVIRKVLKNGVVDVVNPTLKNIPLMKLGGANAEFSFPSSEGDRVLLVAFSRDASKWKRSSESDIVPNSCSGCSLNDLVAIPIVKQSTEGAAKVRVTDEGDIVLTPASGRKAVVEADLNVKGHVWATDEIAALCANTADEWLDSTAVHLSTHIHPTAVGPTSAPTPGT